MLKRFGLVAIATVMMLVQGQQEYELEELTTLFDEVTKDWGLLTMRSAAKTDLKQLNGLYIDITQKASDLWKDKTSMIEIKAMANNIISLRNKAGQNLTLEFEAGSQGQNEGGYFVDFKHKKEPDSDMGQSKKEKKFGDDIK